MQYRGYEITQEQWDGEVVIWVETADGPFDVPTLDRAKEYIDAMIEEDAEMADQPAAR
ncbi:MAG: hypothetical protein AB7O57_04210 [Hyphomicrobiaceae bacterium]